jgi:hypothetical protein
VSASQSSRASKRQCAADHLDTRDRAIRVKPDAIAQASGIDDPNRPGPARRSRCRCRYEHGGRGDAARYRGARRSIWGRWSTLTRSRIRADLGQVVPAPAPNQQVAAFGTPAAPSSAPASPAPAPAPAAPAPAPAAPAPSAPASPAPPAPSAPAPAAPAGPAATAPAGAAAPAAASAAAPAAAASKPTAAAASSAAPSFTGEPAPAKPARWRWRRADAPRDGLVGARPPSRCAIRGCSARAARLLRAGVVRGPSVGQADQSRAAGDGATAARTRAVTTSNRPTWSSSKTRTRRV